MARKPNSLRTKRVASATKSKKRPNNGRGIPKDIDTKFKVASRKPRKSIRRT